MANGKKNCPECKHPNVMPAAGTKKITCGGCGMIIVLSKVYGDDWAKAAEPAQAGRPKIVTKRDRKTNAPAEAAAATTPTASGSPGRRGKSRGRSQHADEGEGHSHSRRRSGQGGMSPTLLWGSIGAIIVAGLLVGVVVKTNSDKKAEEAQIARLEAEKDALKKNSGGKKESAKANENDTGIPKFEIPGGDGAGAGEQAASTTAETTKPTKKESRSKRSYDAFPLDQISAEAKTAIDGAIAILKDLDATTEIRGAGRVLFQHRKDAIPVLINELYTIDVNDESDVKRGWSLIQELKTCAEHATGYENTFQIIEWPTEAKDLEQGASRRRTALKEWHKWWSDNREGWTPPAEEEW